MDQSTTTLAPLEQVTEQQSSPTAIVGSTPTTSNVSSETISKSVDANPTVYPASPFDPQADALILHKAMKGIGTNERKLITVLCCRTRDQRVAISQAYQSTFGKDLELALKRELSGDVGKVLVGLSLPVTVFIAREVRDAISGLGTDDQALIDILCTSSNQEIKDLNNVYLNLHKRSLETDINNDTSGDFRKLLVSLVQGKREESQVVDQESARNDALLLFRAGEKRMGTDESVFNSIFSTRSWAQLRQIMTEYQTLRGHSLEQAVTAEFSFHAKKAFLALLEFAQSQPAYFAKRLHLAMKGVGTDNRCLIRILVTRCDVDLNSIKDAYLKEFGRNLASDVMSDTSGDYRKALLTLLS